MVLIRNMAAKSDRNICEQQVRQDETNQCLYSLINIRLYHINIIKIQLPHIYQFYFLGALSLNASLIEFKINISHHYKNNDQSREYLLGIAAHFFKQFRYLKTGLLKKQMLGPQYQLVYNIIQLLQQFKMLIGDFDYPVEEAAIFFVLILSLTFNSFLFRRGDGDYSIKYELMRNQQFFRKHMAFTYIIQGLYKFFFALPFLLLIVLAVLASIRDVKNLPAILINGLIILLMFYPIKKKRYYWKMLFIWLLALGSQLSTCFITIIHGNQVYFVLSAIFYTSNVILFYIGIVSIQQVYWELSQAVNLIPDEVREVNQRWPQQGLPKVFDGGIYGFFCKNQYTYLQFFIIYLISIILIVIYSVLLYAILGTKLGFIGLVTTIIYDIFVQIFNSLVMKGRTLKTVFPVIFVSRFLVFIFGIQNWLLGYCVLYFFVAVFIGWLIIEKHFPLKPKSTKSNQETKFINALKTPQFVLFILTIEIIIMILVEAFALKETKDPQLTYNNVSIPIWQWGVLAIIAAWVVNFYMLSVRVLTRKHNKIFELTQYYFGFSKITQYHIYVLTSYLLLIALGLYATLYLNQKLVLVCCIFIPLLYFCLLTFGVAWTKNQYKILADIEQHNIFQKKAYQARKKKEQTIKLNEKLKDKKKQLMVSNLHASKGQRSGGFLASIKLLEKKTKIRDDDIKQEGGEVSGVNLNPGGTTSKYKQQQQEEGGYVSLRNWRSEEQNVKCSQIWGCLTPNDKKIIVATIIFILLTVGFCLTSELWCSSKLAISIMVCIISYLTLLPYVRFYKTKAELLTAEIIGNWIGFALGIVYWSVFNSEVIGPIAFSLGYILFAVFCLIKCYKTQVNAKVMVSPAIQTLLCIIMIEVTLAVHKTIVQAVVFGIIFFIFIVLQVPLFYILVHEYVPKLVIILCSITIAATIIVLSVLGYIFNLLSSFAIFSIIMAFIFIAFFATSIIFYLYRSNKNAQNPCVYSAYGEPTYRFESGKQVFKSNSTHLVLFSLAMTTIVVYSVIVTIFFDQKQWAVYGLSFFLLAQFFVNIQVSISSYLYIGVYKQKKIVNKQLVLQSFNKLKNSYMADQIAGQDSPYYEAQFNEAKVKAHETNDPEDWRLCVLSHDLYMKNLQQQERFGFYWLCLIIFNILAKKRQKITKTLAELKSIQQQLISNGIIIQCLESDMKPHEKYEKALKQIGALQPVDFIIYEQILQNHRAEQAKKKKQIQQMQKKQEEQNNKRNEQLYNEMKNQKVVSAKDQIKQFNDLVASLGNKSKYCDQQFPANQKVLGAELQPVVASWRRPNTLQMLTKGGISADDVKQGMIGDCYLVSSFAVLGEKKIKQALGENELGQQLWRNQRGAYMIRFFKFSKQVYIIIDDLLPVNEQDEFVFAKSEEPLQFWPCILEKAYAKLYGGYYRIVQGKSHQVLADFTGGFPFQIILQQYKSNPNGLWTQIISSIENGYLLAAGSPPSPQGDAATSKRGIVQGHAYSVLGAKAIDQFRLIKLKNPHGSGGRQWTGDFSDKSALLTKRIMGLLSHQRGSDGIFWMPIEDFILQFRSIYICAVFDSRWKKFGPIAGQWTIENSFGTPNNIGADKNPHYGIQVTKKCTLFISLSQQPVSALKGKNPIFMKVVRNKGKRITPECLTPQNSVGRAKRPVELVTVSTEIELESDEFPYVFSLMVSCDKPGKTGKFTIQAYCDDPLAEIIDDSQFDRDS